MLKSSLPRTVAVAALLLLAGDLAAQACIGLPTRDGEIALAAAGGQVGGETQYGGEFAADVSGPGAFAFSYGGLGADGDRQLFSGRASYELFLVEPSVCAVAGVLFDTAPGTGIEERLGVPLGIGIGKTLPARDFTTTVFAVPQYVWLRETRAAPVLDGEETLTSNEFMAEAGVTLRFRPVYVGGSILVSTFDEGDPGLRLRAGLVF